jgi:hypothetical protein
VAVTQAAAAAAAAGAQAHGGHSKLRVSAPDVTVDVVAQLLSAPFGTRLVSLQLLALMPALASHRQALAVVGQRCRQLEELTLHGTYSLDALDRGAADSGTQVTESGTEAKGADVEGDSVFAESNRGALESGGGAGLHRALFPQLRRLSLTGIVQHAAVDTDDENHAAATGFASDDDSDEDEVPRPKTIRLK